MRCSALIATALAVIFASPFASAQRKPRTADSVDAAPSDAPAPEPQPEEPVNPDEEGGAAAPKPKAKLPGDDIDENEPEPPLIPAARDTRAGHLMVSPGVSWVLPLGKLSGDVSQASALEPSPGFSLDAGFGVSRTVVLGVWGQYVNFDADCSGCSARSIAGGAFIRYHLVQGVRLDPWMSAGIGYRSTTIDAGIGGDQKYSGLEYLRLQLGGDWYPQRNFGFGPFIEFDAGIYDDKPTGSGDSALHMQVQAGLRLTFDVPGR